MTLAQIPWIELAILVPLIGAMVTTRIREPHRARQWACAGAGGAAAGI